MTSAPESIGSVAIFQIRLVELGLGKIGPEFGADLKGRSLGTYPTKAEVRV